MLKGGKLKLPKAGWVKIRQHREIKDGLSLKGATICMEANGKYHVSLLYSCEGRLYHGSPILPLAWIFLWRNYMFLPKGSMVNTRIISGFPNGSWQESSGSSATARKAAAVTRSSRGEWPVSTPIWHISEKISCINAHVS